MKKPKQKPAAKTASKQAASKTNPAPIIGKVKKPESKKAVFVIETDESFVSIRGCPKELPLPPEIQEMAVGMGKEQLKEEFSSIKALAAKLI